MPIEIKVPSVGESITEGVLSRWLKKNGENVRADEPVLELETEKATTEVAAPASGKLVTTVPEGKTVAIGTVVGRIEEAEAPSTPAPKKEATGDGVQAKAPETAKMPAGTAGMRAAGQPEADAKRPAAPPGGDARQVTPSGPPALSPAARRLAEETGTSVEQIAGSGRGGRIT